MSRTVKCLMGVLVVLLAGASARAELKLVVNFEGMSGNPDSQACNGVLGGVLFTESKATGNATLGTIDGSNAMNVIGHSSGTLVRGMGFNGITNPIDKGETGIGFFRFMVANSSHAVRSHMGLIADPTATPAHSAIAADAKLVPAGFRNGAGFDLVTTDGAIILQPGLARAQWYSVWIVADHAANTFDLYVSKAVGPAGAPALPIAADLVKGGLPFGVATTDSLNAIIFANPAGTGQAERIYVDEIWWDGDQGLAKSTSAALPSPADKEQDVSRDVILGWKAGPTAVTHDVYFGTSLADVGAADRSKPLGVLAGQDQQATTFDPTGLLELGRTYYWRVDEVNNASSPSVSKGAVWSFTVEPVSYPIAKVTATASSSNDNMGPSKTVDGSGLNAADQHATEPTQMWLSANNAARPAWIQYEFDGAYKLDRMLVWNSNQIMEAVLGFGAKSVTVEHSADAATWTKLGDFEFARASGAATYAANTTVDFGGAIAKYVRLTINSNWGGVLAQYGLSEVRFLYVPVLPRMPMPAVAQTGVEVDSVLSWRAGREAASHQVYFGTDQKAVSDGTAPVQTVAGSSSFDPGVLNLGTTYYWKVAEVNNAETPGSWTGDVWSFTTKEYLVVEDFESYDDDANRIYDAWIDGLTDGSSGSTVGYLAAPFAERTIIHGGKQSMPFEYNNVNAPFYSEANREFASLQNWTTNGADSLSLWVRGYPGAYVENAGVVTMSGSGHDIWDNADDFRLAYKSLAGNGSVVVKVESIENTNAWAKAGVIIRQSLDADSKFAYMVVSYSSGVSFGWRQQTAGTCGSVNQVGVAAPQWVKLTRTGDAFTAQYSADGKTWLDVKNADGTIATTTVAMTGSVYVGLCVTSHNAAATTVAVMSGAATTGSVTGSWQVAAIGDDPETANGPADLYVTVQDSAGKTARATNPTAVTSSAWTQWKIPLNSFTGVSLSKVKKLYVGVGSRTNPTKGGAGKIYIDDIGFGRSVSP